MATTLSTLTMGQLLPPSIRNDPTMAAMGQAVDPYLQAIAGYIGLILLWPRLDELSENLLDHLAWQYHVDGYDKADTVAAKRALVSRAIELHRYKGTPWAVETALDALGWPCTLTEWFDYAGDPYKFKVTADGTARAVTAETWTLLEEAINAWKNVRSHLDEIAVVISQAADGPVIGAGCISYEHVTIEPAGA